MSRAVMRAATKTHVGKGIATMGFGSVDPGPLNSSRPVIVLKGTNCSWRFLWTTIRCRGRSGTSIRAGWCCKNIWASSRRNRYRCAWVGNTSWGRLICKTAVRGHQADFCPKFHFSGKFLSELDRSEFNMAGFGKLGLLLSKLCPTSDTLEPYSANFDRGWSTSG